MTKKTKRLQRALALLLLGCMLVSLAACGGREDNAPSQSGESVPASRLTYTVTVEDQDGNPLEGLGIYVYADSSREELVWFAKTDASGAISFTDAESDSYIAVLNNPPQEYLTEESYPLTGADTKIVLRTDPELTGDLSRLEYKLGDRIHDFTVTAPDGTEYTLSRLLEEKKAVVLNFFFQECAPCRTEFPYLQEAYEKYSQDIEVLAMNPVNDDPDALTAFQAELELTFPMVLCDTNWAKAMGLIGYPTTVVIDRSGTICLIHTGMITDAETFEKIFAIYGAEDYVQTVVNSVEELPEPEETDPEENFENPTEVGGVTSFQVMVKPGEEIFVDVYKVSGMYMQIKNPNAYVIYKGKTYSASVGSVGLVVTSSDTYSPVRLGFGNSGTETQKYTVTFSHLQGTVNNPYKLGLGDISVKVNAGNDQGLYFVYTAEETGTLTAQCLSVTKGVEYDFVLYNLNTYAYRNLSTDGGTDASGYPAVSVDVRKGDKVHFIVGTLPDSSHSYPAGSFKFRISLNVGDAQEEETVAEKVAYAVSVTDENRKPISGVHVYLSANGSTTTLITDQNGVASEWLNEADYAVRVAVPNGYAAYSSEFLLTKSNPVISVKLDTVVPVEMLSYTVKVVDEDGKPISGAMVTVGTAFGITDAKGEVSFTLEKGSYTAMVAAPAGYTADAAGYPFEGNTTKLVVTLQTDSGEDTDPDAPSDEEEETDTRIDYSITVTDGTGTPLTGGVAVRFLQEGNLVGMAAINSKGVATVKLEPGEYTVELAFSGTAYHYDSSHILLTQTVTTGTVSIAVPTSPEDTTSLYVCGNAYNVYAGDNYISLGAGEMNYSADVNSYGNNCFFVFIPKEAGHYQVSINSGARLSYWGSSIHYISNQTGSMDVTDNTFTLTVSEDNLANGNVMCCIIGVEVTGGVTNSVLTIRKTGDVENKNLVTDYVGTHKPRQFTLAKADGKKLVYVDVTGNTADYKLVYNANDEYYHLGSANGPVVLMNLGYDAPYDLSIKLMLETTSMNSSYYDAEGYLRGEDFTACMSGYVECIDESYGVYPLTKDLMYMVQEHGRTHDWWTEDSFIFAGADNINPELSWMFACCYVPQS